MNNPTDRHNIGPSAKVILDSRGSQYAQRLITMEITCHRFILAEFNTHRMFSRNSASSRAIPYEKQRNKIAQYPAYPLYWGSEKSGMQSGDELGGEYLTLAKKLWDKGRVDAMNTADMLHELGLHKSLVNRILEPFMWHTIIVTATEWDNFFTQRCHKDAQPEMYALAHAMREAVILSSPTTLTPGEWHMPYVDQTSAEWEKIDPRMLIDIQKRVSVARCARVSYLNHDGTRDYLKDLKLFDKLNGSGHWSPFEHVATPMEYDFDRDIRSGNFYGWHQYRQEVEKRIPR